MGKLVDLSVFSHEDEPCSRCGMEKAETDDINCCKDEQKQLKVQDDHKGSYQHDHSIQKIEIQQQEFYSDPVILFSSAIAHPLSNAPPRWQKVHATILHCSFLI
jgi:hypothetical protein